MAILTDFDEWLRCIDLSNYNDVYSLYRTVIDFSDNGSFSIHPKDGNLETNVILSSREIEDSLILSSESDRKAFLKKLEDTYCGELDMESYYSFRHAMENND